MERYLMFVDQKNNVVNMFVLSKAFYRLNAIPTKIPMAILTQIEKTILKSI